MSITPYLVMLQRFNQNLEERINITCNCNMLLLLQVSRLLWTGDKLVTKCYSGTDAGVTRGMTPE